MRNAVILLVIFMFSSCAKVSTIPTIDKVYKMDLFMSSGAQEGMGTLMLPRQDSYAIQVESDGKINLLTFRTCSREISVQDPRQGLSRKRFTIKYTPNEVERSGVCQSEVMALNIGGQNSLGFIDYQDADTTLPAENICGGITEKTIGVSICQEREGMLEKIKFDVEVMADPTDCILDKTRGREFTYSIKRGRCIMAFIEVKKPNRVHRLTTLGYQELLMSL
jgi:hypothetical protein